VFIKIKGISSGKITHLEVSPEQLPFNLLEFLRVKGTPIASSCRGEGICRLCIVNDSILSCEVTVQEYLELHGDTLTISYL
jgi:Na+-transporting NADH:ubiquinone oxidoreductase subunit NqrF